MEYRVFNPELTESTCQLKLLTKLPASSNQLFFLYTLSSLWHRFIKSIVCDFNGYQSCVREILDSSYNYCYFLLTIFSIKLIMCNFHWYSSTINNFSPLFLHLVFVPFYVFAICHQYHVTPCFAKIDFNFIYCAHKKITAVTADIIIMSVIP